MAILVAGIIIYFKRNVVRSMVRKYSLIIFGVLLILIQTGNTFVSRPLSSDHAVAFTALISYTLFTAVAFLLEKKRKEA